MGDDWAATRREIESYTETTLDRLESEWSVESRRPTLELGPRGHDPDAPPASASECLDHIGGIASVIVFYTDEHRETVLVYNRAGGWEPPGGVVENGQSLAETARTEAREETGLTVSLTDLLYTRTVEFAFADGSTVPLPVAQFVGHRTDGTLRIEREGRTHPGCTRATGLFDIETLPEVRRERAAIADLLNDPPAWEPGDE
ncbi:NUDIX hydrolase [Halosegnis longus]|uniref:NUDIX hydrolase n=1 Tax=Halosegnis longus TaxID=2216012 RepID=A0AAJ4R8K0_9EURY|nr:MULTISPECIES: NUDIX hydrolase [Halobacteriales]RNJ26488.1 NUDIX hydrolase [Salella cibi]